ncbi:MAG: ABC transporter ATP-binding protein, partial [Actinomycetia bacterium]|nr:ABC transporter ATP-binding protein [Actinomycetes bacterium]
SHGNKQKLGLIQAFMHKPELLILDEPTLGLDPLMQQEFYDLVAEARTAGQTIFLCSHILPEIERICDRVGFIRKGQLIAVEEVSALKKKALRKLQVYFGSPITEEAFKNINGVEDVKVEGSILYCTVVGSLDNLIKTASGYEVINIISEEPDLEDIFMKYYGGGS